MPWVEEKLDDDFKQWILDFHKDQYPYMLSLLEKAQAVKEIYHFTSRKEADAYLDDLQKKITTLYFIRHAEADYHHKEERTRPLSEKGKRSCQQICDFFADQPLDAVYSSPYKRAVDTIQALADQKRLNIITLEALKERCISSEWIADYDTFVQKQWEDFSYKLSCGESLKEVQKRNISAVMEILDKHVGHQVIIGTHGTAFATILNYFDPAFGYEDFLKIKDLTPYLVAMTFDMHKWIGIQKKQFSNM